MGDVRWPTSRSKVTQHGHVMVLLVISFLSCLVNGQSGLQALQPSARAIPNYKIVPKPCKVKALEGTCMFVWECLKTDGKAIGMCVDGFMFGSCCVHNVENNLLDSTSEKNVTFRPASTAGSEILSIVTSNEPKRPIQVALTSTIPTSVAQVSTSLESKPVSLTTQASSGPDSTLSYRPLSSLTSDYITVASVTPDYKPVTSDYRPVSSVTVPQKQVSFSPVSEKPVLVSSSVSLIGSKPAVELKPDETGSGSAIIQSNGVVSQMVSGVKTVPAPVESSAVIGSSLSISSGRPAITVPSPEYFPDGIIIQKATKPTRPSTSSKPTTPSTTTKLQTISLSSSGEPTYASTTQTHKPIHTSTTEFTLPSTTQTREKVPPTPSKLTGVETESTVGAHESHSIDAQHFLFSSTTAIGQKTSQEPPTSAPEATPTEFPDVTNFVTNPDVVTQNLFEFPEYLLEVTSAPNGANKRCGTPNPLPKQPTTRVVGGSNSVYGAWPWQASVRRTSFFGFSSTHRCGGTLLNEQWVITAAHCVEDLLLTQIRVRLGEYDVASLTEAFPVVERSITKKIVHPKYNFFTYEYDIALLRLEEPVEFSPTISPICLPSSDDLLVGMNGTVTGWGRLSEGGTLPNVLQQVTLPIISNDKCKNMFLKSGRHEFIPEIFLCTGYEEGGRDACQGDSGGPLQMKARDGRYFLAGIISWGIGCAEPNLPGVCTRISKFTNWILENVNS